MTPSVFSATAFLCSDVAPFFRVPACFSSNRPVIGKLSVMPNHTQIVRMEKHRALPGLTLAHAMEKTLRREAVARGHDTPPVFLIDGDFERAQEDLASCLAVMRRGRPGTPVAKLVLAGPPPAGAPDPWSDDKFRAWCLACRGWKVAGLGEGPTVAAVTVDRDKRALCFWCVCRVEDGKGGWKLSVDAVIERLAGGSAGRRTLSLLHDRFHEDVGQRFGLTRGGRHGAHVVAMEAGSALAPGFTLTVMVPVGRPVPRRMDCHLPVGRIAIYLCRRRQRPGDVPVRRRARQQLEAGRSTGIQAPRRHGDHLGPRRPLGAVVTRVQPRALPVSSASRAVFHGNDLQLDHAVTELRGYFSPSSRRSR